MLLDTYYLNVSKYTPSTVYCTVLHTKYSAAKCIMFSDTIKYLFCALYHPVQMGILIIYGSTPRGNHV